MINISRIIALHGMRQSGKDTIAEHLVSQHGFTRLAFADRLKHELCALFDVSLLMFTCQSMKEERHEDLALCHCELISFPRWYAGTPEGLSEIDSGIRIFTVPRTPRWLMQRYGDWRRSQSELYFIKPVVDAICSDYSKSFVVTDVRTEREASALAGFHLTGENYSLWEVVRPGTGNVTHFTDMRIRSSYVDHVVRNDGTLDDLKKSVSELLTRF